LVPEVNISTDGLCAEIRNEENAGKKKKMNRKADFIA